jgi:molybdopterin synthase sulfur carrier subunit
MVYLRYFARLRETLGVGDEQVELPAHIGTVKQLAGWLQTRGANWQQALSDTRLHVAVNQQIVKADNAVHDGDEIAWFPPVTGG